MKAALPLCFACAALMAFDAAAQETNSGPNSAEAMQAYQKALEQQKLAATVPLSRSRLQEELSATELMLERGRRDEAIGNLVYLIESPRFEPFKASQEGRKARYLLGEALGSAGAYEPARRYLEALLAGDPNDLWYRRAAKSLVDFALESEQYGLFEPGLKGVPPTAPAELVGDIYYLKGRAAEQKQDHRAALAAYGHVSERSRFWAQATYLSGLIEVERGKLQRGEQLFCKVADPKQTPRLAPVFGGSDFFRVRDLARLGLGRVAHEQYRFDDARYYYYLVPQDSEHLPEALYETATTRYESRDYAGARQALDELLALEQNHPYEDEVYILDAYVDLANCRFPSADKKLNEFLRRYEPVRDAARRVVHDVRAMKKLVEAERTGSDPAAGGLGLRAGTARALAALLRVDPRYSQASKRLARLEHQLSGLRGAMGQLDEAKRRLSTPNEVRAQSQRALGQTDTDKLHRIRAQLFEVKRLLKRAEASPKLANERANIKTLRDELETLELRARALEARKGVEAPSPRNAGSDLQGVIVADRAQATNLYAAAQNVKRKLEADQLALAKDAFKRLDLRVSRLLRRARLGRIETVLGKKHALELEIEALSQGLIPHTIVDSLDAARYLGQDEEYWPFDGEDWEDEYVGGERLR